MTGRGFQPFILRLLWSDAPMVQHLNVLSNIYYHHMNTARIFSVGKLSLFSCFHPICRIIGCFGSLGVSDHWVCRIIGYVGSLGVSDHWVCWSIGCVGSLGMSDLLGVSHGMWVADNKEACMS